MYVALGGMRGVTYVQAFQFWVKTFAIALPACLLLIHLGGLPARAALFGRDLPRAPAHGLVVKLGSPQKVQFPLATTYRINGRPALARAGEKVTLRGRLVLPPRAAVPVADGTTPKTGREWARPVTSGGGSSPLFVYSLLVATLLGTMGLPHILVRFYTNRDGPAARRTTVRVLGLLGLFYLFPCVYGALGRALSPSLYVTGSTDTVVLKLPHAAWPGAGGDLLGALVAAGAFAAFMSTSSGLLVSIAGTTSYDIWGREAGPHERRLRFRIVAAFGMLPPALLALTAHSIDISVLVGWAFALAASTFCPMFLLGIWWTRLTARGAAAGMIAGGVVASGLIFAGLIRGEQTDVLGALLAQPAVASVPIAFVTMIATSLLDGRVPGDVREQMLALHAPEDLGLERLEREPAVA
jgi:cation/acetate symporter